MPYDPSIGADLAPWMACAGGGRLVGVISVMREFGPRGRRGGDLGFALEGPGGGGIDMMAKCRECHERDRDEMLSLPRSTL